MASHACAPWRSCWRDPEIEIVLNLTTPESHGTIALAALEAGKSVYNEKPLAITRAEGAADAGTGARQGAARRRRAGHLPGRRLCRPCRKLIDDGAIGAPVAANAFMMSHGHEHWHPNPEFYYKAGGGPMFDMGPYYLTALVTLLGPVRRVSGTTRITRTRAHDQQPAAQWRDHRRGGADARGRAARLRRRADRARS